MFLAKLFLICRLLFVSKIINVKMELLQNMLVLITVIKVKKIHDADSQHINIFFTGISVNCYDIYRYNIDCQWIDITDIDFGYYRLKISINPDFSVSEMDYHNNGASCSLVYSPSNAMVYDCKLERP